MQLEQMSNQELIEVYDRLLIKIEDIEQQYREVLPNIYVTRAQIKDILSRRGLNDSILG